MKTFYSNGKLLLTGEYAVLDGALCLALPTRYGQSLKPGPISEKEIQWKSKDHQGAVWFEAHFPIGNIKEVTQRQASKASIRVMLIQILQEARRLNPAFLSGEMGFAVVTQMDFPRNWGLGTSSTLINNVAQWAGVNPYELLCNTFGGSGYDIACAQLNGPILYHLEKKQPRVTEIDFNPSFSSSLFFVYLNRKQDSREAISSYRNKQIHKQELVNKISSLTQAMAGCEQLEEFESLLERHEALISGALGIPPIKESHFPDYPGKVKSLGAWGGDFVLATGPEKAREYFSKKGYTTTIPYADMILQKTPDK